MQNWVVILGIQILLNKNLCYRITELAGGSGSVRLRPGPECAGRGGSRPGSSGQAYSYPDSDSVRHTIDIVLLLNYNFGK